MTPSRAIWLLTRLRLLRLLNQLRSAGTRGKRGRHGLLVLGVAAVMLFGLFQLSSLSVLHLHCQLDSGSACPSDADAALGDFTLSLAGGAFSAALAGGLTLQLTLALLVATVLPLAGREMAQPDWDLEWLVTLPLSRPLLLMARVVERAFSNPVGLLGLFPLCCTIAWAAGARWSAPLLGAVVTLPLLLTAALLWTLVDTGLRLKLAPARLRNLQALVSLFSMPLMFLAISFSSSPSVNVTLQFDLARAVPPWALWTPAGLAVQALQGHGAMLGLLWLATAIILAVGLALLAWQLKAGVVGSGGRESGRLPVVAPGKAVEPARRRWLSPAQGRELTLLMRDRNFLVQSLVLPLVILLSQLLLHGQLSSLTAIGAQPTVMAAIAFGLGTNVLMLSAMQALNREGGALWLLYTFPQPMSMVLRQKAQMWAVLALSYPLAVFATGMLLSHQVSWQSLRLMVLVLLGLPIYAYLAVAIGVFASDPLGHSQGKAAQLKPTSVYLYLMLASLYVFGLLASHWWPSVVLLVLLAALAFAFWQKACDQLPYLLDPDVAPPARVAAADGLIAALLFFVGQGLLLLLFTGGRKAPDVSDALGAFAAAGVLVYLLMRAWYWRAKTQGVPRLLGANMRQALLWGVGGGLAMAAFGIAYVALLRHADFGPGLLPVVTAAPAQRGWLLAAVVLAAPLCEEFIFRGLIYGGLRRSMPVWLATLGSAAVFAIIHPPQAMLPVFVLGLVTAWAYERNKVLLAPVLVHAIYNGAVLGLELFG